MAQIVRITSPPIRWLSHKKIGAHAAKVPHDEPVATDNKHVTNRAAGAMVLAVTPSSSARLIKAAPTPVAIKHSATA